MCDRHNVMKSACQTWRLRIGKAKQRSRRPGPSQRQSWNHGGAVTGQGSVSAGLSQSRAPCLRGPHGTGLCVCGVLTEQGFVSQAKSFGLDPEGEGELLAILGEK